MKIFKHKKKLKQASSKAELDYIIGQLARDSSEEIRIAVASNTSAPMHALEELAFDKSIAVKRAVLHNAWKMSPRIFRYLQRTEELKEELNELYPAGPPEHVNWGPKFDK